MTVDLYKPCPCGSGKKIKFCCRDIANDLERIQRMIEGEQRLAAIEKIDSVLKKHPKHSALLMLKAEVNLQLREFEKASEIVGELLEIDAQNPSAHGLATLCKIIDRKPVAEVLASIQYSLECVQEVMTRTVYDAIYGVVNYLINEGLPFSAKGYLQFAIMVSDGKDSRCISMLNQLNRTDSIPFLIREHIDSGARPQDVTWAREFDVAMHVASRGMWGRAVQMLRDMSYRILDEPAILRNLAIVLALNGETKEAAKIFRQFSDLSRLPMLDRVHAMALANVFDPESADSLVDLVNVRWAVTDTDKCLEALRTSDLTVSNDVQNVPNDQPQPKAGFDLIDRPMPKEGDEIKPELLPAILGRVFVYGKQTDRDARVELIRAQDAGFDAGVKQLTDLVGDFLGEQQEPELITKTSRVSTESIGAIKFPEFVKPEDTMKLQRQRWAYSIHHKWVNQPMPFFDGKTPKEAAPESKYKIRLLAELLSFEVENELDSLEYGIDIDALHEELGIPKREPIDVAQRPIKHVPVSHLGRVNIEGLSDDELLEAYRYAFAVFAGGILKRICLEIAKRDSIVDKIDKVEVYDVLSDLSGISDEALEWLEKARKLATSQNESPALWLVDEMQLRLLRGEAEKFQLLMKEVQNRYMKEPGVAQALLSMLQRFGLVGPDGNAVAPPPGAADQAAQPVGAASDGGLWTPDGSAAPQGGKEQGESKLWIPD